MEAKKSKGVKEVLAFLILEIFAFVSFTLGNSFIFYSLLIIALTALLVFFIRKQLNKDGLSTIAIFIIPLFAFALLTTLSNFTVDSGLDVFTRILIPISLVCFAASGYLSTYYSEFKLKTFFMVIYGALAILVILSFGYTMIQYTPFYTLIHSDSYIYYEGKPSPLPLGKMAYFLIGFKFIEVDVSYLSFYASILFSAIVPLMFIKYKEDKKRFLLFAACTFIGGITLLFTPTKFSIISTFLVVVVITIIILLGKSVIKAKWIKYTSMGIAAVFDVLLIILFLNAQENWTFLDGFRNMIASNVLLDRLFNSNGLVVNYNFILNDLFSNIKIFGFPLESYNALYGDNVGFSGSWLFDIILTSGIFGYFFFVIFIIMAARQLIKYYNCKKDNKVDKLMVLSYICVTFAFAIFDYPSDPFVYHKGFMPFYMSAPFLICLFLFGYTFKKDDAEIIAKTTQNDENTEMTI